jgi:hypothetical protein
MDFKTPSRSDYTSHRPQTDIPQPKPEPAPGPKPKKQRKGRGFIGRWWKRTLIVLAILVIAGLAYGYLHTKNQLEDAKNGTSSSDLGNSTAQVVNKVSKLVDLPTTEAPTLATINDAEKLESQSQLNKIIFAGAKNGDQVKRAASAKPRRPSTWRPTWPKPAIRS